MISLASNDAPGMNRIARARSLERETNLIQENSLAVVSFKTVLSKVSESDRDIGLRFTQTHILSTLISFPFSPPPGLLADTSSKASLRSSTVTLSISSAPLNSITVVTGEFLSF